MDIGRSLVIRHRGADRLVWQHIFSGGDLDWMVRKDQVAACYCAVFAGAPYFEDYKGQEETFILPWFRRFSESGIAAFLTTSETFEEGEVIGFAGCLPAEICECADFVGSHPAFGARDLRRYMYMAEVGVLDEYRRQGLGTGLIIARAHGIDLHFPERTHLLVRTAARGSNSWPLYRKHGAAVIPNLIQPMEDHGTQSTERMFIEVEVSSLLASAMAVQ